MISKRKKCSPEKDPGQRAERAVAAVYSVGVSALWLLLYLALGLLAVILVPREWRAALNFALLAPAVWLLSRRFVPEDGNFLLPVLGIRSVHSAVLLLAAAAGIGLNLALSAALELLPLPADLLGSYENAAEPLTSLAPASVLNTVVFVPLLEETVFRGLILRTLRRGVGTAAALIISTAVFAVLHTHPLWIAYAALCGLILGGTYLVFNSTVPCIMLHLGFNAANFIPSFLPVTDGRGKYYAALAAGSALFAACAAVGVICARKNGSDDIPD